MKYFILALLLFANSVFSETNAEYNVDINFIEDAGNEDLVNFKNKFTYRNTKATAIWKDNSGDYGILKCIGNYM